MLRGRTHLWILRAASLIVFVLVVSPARAAKPPQRAMTSSPGPAVMTPAEREKLARWQAGEYPAEDPSTVLTPLPPLRWDAVRTTPAEGAALCIYGLINNHQGVTISVDSYFHLNQQFIYWSAFAVRPLGSADWDVRMYDTTAPDPQCVSSLLTLSEFPIGVDYVVGDYNHSPIGSDYIFVNRFAGTEDAIVQWDTGADIIGLTGAIHRSYTPNDIIEIWDVNFSAKHNYTFYLDGGVIGNTGLTLQIFQNPASAPYYAPRDVNIHQQGAGYGNVTPLADDWYGLTVVNENGGTGQYDVAIRECTNPLQLPYEDSRALTAPGEIFFVQPGVGAWAGMGVRGDNGSGWIAQLREYGNIGPWPACNGPLVASDEGLQTRLVLGDFHVNPPGEYYPVGLKMIGTGASGGRLEWDDGRKFIVVNGGAVSKTPPASDVFELWNVSLARNFPYTIEFASAGANYKLFLFGNPTGSVFWPVRSQRILETTATRTVFTPTFTGAYALVVVNDNGGTGDYSVAILSGAVGVEDAGASMPVTRLTGAAPNPTRGDVRIDFELGRAARVDLMVIDVAGRTVARVAGRDFTPGSWSEHWTGKDANGRSVPAGTYWIRLAAGGREIGRQKVLVVR